MGTGLDNMAMLAEAIDEDTRRKLGSTDLWHRLEQYRASTLSSSGQVDEVECTELSSALLNEVDLRLLFIAVDYAHLQGNEAKCKIIDHIFVTIFGTSLGPKLYQETPDTVHFFLAGLGHSAAAVRKLTAKTIVALGQGQPEGSRERCRSLLRPPLLPTLVGALGGLDTGAAQGVADALVALCEVASPSNTTETGPSSRKSVMAALVSQLGDVIAGLPERDAATPKLRFADTAARLMSASETAFKEAAETGAVSLVTSLAQDSSDVLLQLNALDLLEQVGSSKAGARHLAHEGHLMSLLKASGGGVGNESTSPDPLLGTSALRTLGKVLAKAAGVGFEIDPLLLRGFLRACASNIESRDESSKVGGIVAMSSVAEVSNAALQQILDDEQGTGGVLNSWLILSRHKVDEKAACLHAVAKVLGPPTPLAESPAAQDEDVSMRESLAVTAEERRRSLAKWLFERLGACNRQATGTLLVELVKRPIPEVRNAAYDVLRCSLWQPGGWALQAVFSQPGFREFLEERDVKASKVTKEWKFSVIESVMQCADRGMLGQDMLDSFRKILKQGPFWVPAKAQDVATLP